MYIKCCVPECDDKVSIRHRFPDGKTLRYKQWLEAINNKDLLSMDPGMVYRNNRICRRHFDKPYYSDGSNRLHCNAIPTLHLPHYTEIPRTDVNQVPDSCTKVFNEIEDSTIETTSDDNVISSTVVFTPKAVPSKSPDKCISTPYGLLKNAGINARTDLTPKKIIKKIEEYCNRKKKFKQRLFEAEKFSLQYGLEENVAELNSVARQFIRCQVREAGKYPKQRRFTVDEKIMSLSIFI